ncbi:MAG: ATP-dependent 6-phosphofructokinase [Thermoguttaceae bacterium]|nr:ATP-dependent 6-phosphofructokinase [Thermoguttaceae bacterium]
MKIGVLCSGGDAPGMNPCLRAIIRAGEKYNDIVVGIRRGYEGLLKEDFWGGVDRKIDPREVSGLTSRGGAFLNSSRCKRMMEEEGLREAAEILTNHCFDALLTIGGNGTLSGARDLCKYWDGQVIGLPGTIDNDLMGTDYTIGFATAVQTGVEAIDKLRDTAGSHDMMFVVEVMGRRCGDLATCIALASGCEVVAVPEVKTEITEIIADLKRFKALGTRSIIMVVAEGDDYGGAAEIMKGLKEAGSPFEMRSVILGHIQRGGVPAPADRILATKLGCFAVDALHLGETGKMAGEIAGKLVLSNFDEVLAQRRDTAVDMVKMIERMSI